MLSTAVTPKALELTKKQLLMLFPTPLFTGVLPDLSVCDRVETFVRDLQKVGKGKSAPPNASRIFMTEDNLHTLPEMKELVDVVMLESGRALDAFAVKRDSHYITDMWANITHPNHFQPTHVHPNCLLSGLVYIRTPANCGPTSFSSPRRYTKNLEPRYLQKNELNSDLFVMPPEKGRMLIWPSHIPHAVEQGTAEESEDRITVPFNVMIRGRINLYTANLDLK
jgi:uncharacterized protein (TIGR02466 family)